MAAMVKRLSHGLVVPVLRVRFPLAAPRKNFQLDWEFFCGREGIEHELLPPRRIQIAGGVPPEAGLAAPAKDSTVHIFATDVLKVEFFV